MAKKKDLLYMNWWVKDFLSDTPDLDAEESGAYMLLIGHCFLEGSIPKDKAKLLRISRLYDTAKEDILDGLIERFFIDDPKGYINRRAIKERDDALTRMKKASTAGTIGAKARWEKERVKKAGLTGDDDILSALNEQVDSEPPIDQPAQPQDSKPKQKKHKYGEYKNVLLTDDERSKLTEKLGEKRAEQIIITLDEGIELRGYRYKSHYLAALKWSKKEDEDVKKTPEIHRWRDESRRCSRCGRLFEDGEDEDNCPICSELAQESQRAVN